MSSGHDLDLRVAALEQRLGIDRDRRVRRGAWAQAGWLLLALLLTANIGMIWQGRRHAASQRIERQFWVLCQPGASGEERRQALTALIQAGNRQWRGARLEHLNLRESRLDGVSLEWAELAGCDLTDSSMVVASLRGANLQLGKLRRVDFSGADLTEAFLRKADLTGATLRQATLRSASLEQADLKDAVFEQADLTEANLLLAVATEAKLRGARLAWANLDAADFSRADLAEADLEGASIHDTYFADSNWWRAVGLTSATVERFKKDFPPSDEAAGNFREDYRAWLRDSGK